MSASFHQRIWIGIITIMAAQTVMGLIWAGGAAQRLAQLERQTNSTCAVMERTARLEAQTQDIKGALIRIEAKLDESRKNAR